MLNNKEILNLLCSFNHVKEISGARQVLVNAKHLEES